MGAEGGGTREFSEVGYWASVVDDVQERQCT